MTSTSSALAYHVFCINVACIYVLFLPNDKTRNHCAEKGISQDRSHVTEKVSLKDKTIKHVNNLHTDYNLSHSSTINAYKDEKDELDTEKRALFHQILLYMLQAVEWVLETILYPF